MNYVNYGITPEVERKAIDLAVATDICAREIFPGTTMKVHVYEHHLEATNTPESLGVIARMRLVIGTSGEFSLDAEVRGTAEAPQVTFWADGQQVADAEDAIAAFSL